MIQELISKIFNTRNHAHIEHWTVSCGYHHTVLGEFYDGVIDALDSFVEAFMGNHGQIDSFQPECYDYEDTFIKCLESDILWLEKYRDALCDGVGSLENIYDDLVDLYLSTRFKLKSLKCNRPKNKNKFH